MDAKDMLIHQTKLAFSEDPEMSLMISIQGLAAETAAKRLNDRIWTIEEIVFHVAFWKIEYCRQGFGKWDHPVRSCLGDFHQTVDFLHRGRDASYPTPPAQIPACRFLAPGSSEVLASVSSFG
jgi:hypothetical protein